MDVINNIQKELHKNTNSEVSQQQFISKQMLSMNQDHAKIEQECVRCDERQQKISDEIGNDDDIWYF